MCYLHVMNLQYDLRAERMSDDGNSGRRERREITWLMNELKISIDLCLCLGGSSLFEDFVLAFQFVIFVVLLIFSDWDA